MLALVALHAAEAGTVRETVRIGDTPTTVFRPSHDAPGPAVVIAHGFAGSQQLMQSFALAFARRGYVAVTFDFLGHGRNPRPLAGDLADVRGATQALVAQTESVVGFARGLGDGRVAILGHSMASDIVVRTAQASPDIAATVAVSMFSPAVTPTSPQNLLVIVGALEETLKAEALRVVDQTAEPKPARDGVTYGSFADGSARRAVFAGGVEHVGVLFSETSLREAADWLDGAFSRRPDGREAGGRGPWILLLLGGLVLAARPMSRLLPVVAPRPLGAGLRWREAWPAIVLPAVATPLVLRVAPTHFLPVIVGDYLAAHFALYGVIVALCLVWIRRRTGHDAAAGATSWSRLALAAALAAAFGVGALGLAIDGHVTSFALIPSRLPLVGALLVGTASYFLANEWLTRGEGAGRGLNAASQVAFLASLALAVGLDFQRLFFLLIIVPVIAPVLVVTSLFGRWSYRRTGHPAVAALGAATLIAWAIGVTFPMLAG